MEQSIEMVSIYQEQSSIQKLNVLHKEEKDAVKECTNLKAIGQLVIYLDYEGAKAKTSKVETWKDEL